MDYLVSDIQKYAQHRGRIRFTQPPTADTFLKSTGYLAWNTDRRCNLLEHNTQNGSTSITSLYVHGYQVCSKALILFLQKIIKKFL